VNTGKDLLPGPLRSRLHNIRISTRGRWRRSTARWRVLPDFIVFGAMKSGTTSLLHYLSQHPRVSASFKNEIHFFDLNFGKGVEWYRAFFPLRHTMGPEDVAGEASPLYIFYPPAPERIHGLLPGVKLIALLRNPTERAISQYFHEVRKGRETLSPMEALTREEERLRPALERGEFSSTAYIHCSYKSRGRYAGQIARYLEYFPREQLLVRSSEQFFRNPSELLAEVFRFVGVDAEVNVPDLKPRNVSSNRTLVGGEVYEYLDRHYREEKDALQNLLGQDFGW
jgi:hypothetical protein